MAKSKEFDLAEYKKTIKDREVQYKPNSYIPVDPCLQEVLALDGIPKNHVTQVYGKSDTGKTSFMFHLAAKCQETKELPVIYITERKVDWERAKRMGFDKEGYALVEENFSTLEEVFEDILDKLAQQGRGELPKNLVFLWDSIGNTVSKDEFKEDTSGNVDIKATMMKAAKVIKNYMRHIGPRINNTRKSDCPCNATLIFINQAYTAPPPPGSMFSKLTPYGGEGIWYAASLVIQTKKIGKIEAVVGGITKKFASKSRFTIEKNHINGMEQAGDFVITPTSIIPNDAKAIKKYKEENKGNWASSENVELEESEDGEF